MPTDAIRELILKELRSRLDSAWLRAGSFDGARSEISHAQEALRQIEAEFARLDAMREEIQRECVRKAIRWLNVHKGWMGWRDNDVETPSFEAAILDATQVSVESDLNQQSRAMRRGQARRRWLMR